MRRKFGWMFVLLFISTIGWASEGLGSRPKPKPTQEPGAELSCVVAENLVPLTPEGPFLFRADCPADPVLTGGGTNMTLFNANTQSCTRDVSAPINVVLVGSGPNETHTGWVGAGRIAGTFPVCVQVTAFCCNVS